MSEPVAYKAPVKDDCGDLMTVAEFIENCECGGFTDYDGFGYPVKDGKTASFVVKPSQREDIPADATHIIWYNR